MALTDLEKHKVRHHLGYPTLTMAPSVQFGIIRATQTLFSVELAMTQVRPEAEPTIRDLLQKLDDTEVQMFDAQERQAAKAVGDITLNPDLEPGGLFRSYVFWANSLASELSVEINKYSPKFSQMYGVPVVR